MIAMKHEKASRKTRGHLTLIEGEQSSLVNTDPVQRPLADRLIDHGLILLVITTIGAVCASMAHL